MKSIMYHYVRNYSSRFPYLNFLHYKNFEKQIEYFKLHYKFFDCNDFSYFQGHKPIKKKIFLTFDDGLSCHYKYVYKILKKNKINGIFYIPTSPFIKSEILQPHKIHLILAKFGGLKACKVLEKNLSEKMIDQKKKNLFKLSTYRNQNNKTAVNFFKKTLNYYLKKDFKIPLTNKIFKILFDNSEKKIAKDFYMDEKKIRVMIKNGMVIGSHSATHPLMSDMSKVETDNEIKKSFDYIGQFYKNRTYCHPYGGFKSFNSYTEKSLFNNKVTFSMNVEPKEISLDQIKKRPHALSRYDCNIFPHGKVFKK